MKREKKKTTNMEPYKTMIVLNCEVTVEFEVPGR